MRGSRSTRATARRERQWQIIRNSNDPFQYETSPEEVLRDRVQDEVAAATPISLPSTIPPPPSLTVDRRREVSAAGVVSILVLAFILLCAMLIVLVWITSP